MFKHLFTAVSCLGVLSQASIQEIPINKGNVEQIKNAINSWKLSNKAQNQIYPNKLREALKCIVDSIVACQERYQIPNWIFKYNKETDREGLHDFCSLSLFQDRTTIDYSYWDDCTGSIYYKTVLFSLKWPVKQFSVVDKKSGHNIKLIQFGTVWTGNVRTHAALGFYECVKMCAASYITERKNYKCCVIPMTFREVSSDFLSETGSISGYAFLSENIDGDKFWNYKTEEDIIEEVKQRFNVKFADIEGVRIEPDGETFYESTKFNLVPSEADIKAREDLVAPELGIKERQEITIPEAKFARILVKRANNPKEIDVTEDFYRHVSLTGVKLL